MHIPVIDIAPFRTSDLAAKLEVARQWREALDMIGFVIVAGHGLPNDISDDIYNAARSFFAQSLDAKMASRQAQSDGLVRGYVPPLTENVGKTMGLVAPADICESFIVPNLLHDDLWRSGGSAPWPTSPPAFRDSVERYVGAAYALGRTLMRISALALDLPEDYFEAHYQNMSHTLRLVEYPDQPEEPLPGQLRNGPHTDFGGFTILKQDNAPGGLQVQQPDGTWVDVPPIPSTLTINTGDLIQRWTNDRWRSNIHRVVNPPRALTGSARRLSIVFFTSPDDGTEIACLPSCATPPNPPKYPPISAKAHTLAKVSQTYSDRPTA
ncbi:MAG: 2OG-Fe(II) oxygenase [Rhodospirillales bacterium]|nr:2OG-Fe(II) oxygenase [Rhodospirillales bacterium]